MTGTPPLDEDRAHRYLVVSDLHLADVEDHDDGWKSHKHSRFVFDQDLDSVVAAFEAEGDPSDVRVLVLNGDIIDFDLVSAVPDEPPWPVSAGERRRGLEPTAEKAVWKLQRVLADHPVFLDTLARFMATTGEVVYVVGNHDPEVHFEAVRAAFAGAVAARAAEAGLELHPERLRFEPWFYYVPGHLYAEHGHQYDYYTSFRYVLSPVVPGPAPAPIALPMGNISNRYLLTRMGYFNPHASDYILNVYAYATHWLKYYAFSRRGLFLPWLIGSLLVLIRLLKTKGRILRGAPDYAALLGAEANRQGLEPETLVTLDALKRPPISGRLYRMIREFWIDRAIVALLMTGGTIALAVTPIPLWVKLMVPLSSFPLLYLLYESVAHGETIFHAKSAAPGYARSIAGLVPAAVITFGHSHVPEVVPLSEGHTYVNTGTWAPVTRQGEGHTLVAGLRNALVVVVPKDGPVEVRLTSHLPPRL